MISRLTAFAATFAVLATASIAFAASTQHESNTAAAKPLPVVQFETIVVTGHRATLADK